MSVFEVGKTISESVGGAAVAGGNSGLGNRFFFTDDTCCEIGLQRGSVCWAPPIGNWCETISNRGLA